MSLGDKFLVHVNGGNSCVHGRFFCETDRNQRDDEKVSVVLYSIFY
jgi:hypothetical protein